MEGLPRDSDSTCSSAPYYHQPDTDAHPHSDQDACPPHADAGSNRDRDAHRYADRYGDAGGDAYPGHLSAKEDADTPMLRYRRQRDHISDHVRSDGGAEGSGSAARSSYWRIPGIAAQRRLLHQ